MSYIRPTNMLGKKMMLRISQIDQDSIRFSAMTSGTVLRSIRGSEYRLMETPDEIKAMIKKNTEAHTCGQNETRDVKPLAVGENRVYVSTNQIGQFIVDGVYVARLGEAFGVDELSRREMLEELGIELL